MKAVILALLVAFVSSEVSAGLGGVMRAGSGKVQQVIARGALAVLLCAGSSCAPLQNSVEPQQTVNEKVASEMGLEENLPLVEEKPVIEKAGVEGNADIPFGAIDLYSVDNYLAQKDQLTAEFYDNMLVHYLDDQGDNYVALLTLADGKLLARHSPIAQYNEIEVEQILGVLIDKDPLSGLVAGVMSTEVLGVNGIKLPAMETELRLVGTINQVFTSNHIQLHVRGFIHDGQLITPLETTGLVLVHGDDLWIIPIGGKGSASIQPALDISARLP